MIHQHFYTADCHLGHESILRHCNSTRGHLATPEDQAEYLKGDPLFRFSKESVKLMDDHIIDVYNRDVPEENTTLWILGDFSLQKDPHKLQEYHDRIKCHDVRLIWGNHDHGPAAMYAFRHYYESTFLLIDPNYGEFRVSQSWRIACEDEVSSKLLKRKSTIRIQLSHYAHATWWHSTRGSYHFYGHSHGTMEEWRKTHLPNAQSCDVGWDCFQRAMPLQELLSLTTKVKPQTPDH